MKRPVRRYLTPDERATLEQHQRDMTVQLETPTLMMGPNGQVVRVADRSNLDSPHVVSAEIRKTKRLLEEGRPHDLTKAEIRERDKEIRRLEDRVKKSMVPENHFRMPDDGSSNYRKVVDELVRQAQDPKLSSDIETLKNLRRERNPDDPKAGSIEDLRKS